MGDLAGARERKRLIAELRQLKSEILLLAEAERHGVGFRPGHTCRLWRTQNA